MGREPAQETRDRSLVADRDRLVHRRQSDGAWAASREARLADCADAGLRRADRGRSLQAGPGQSNGLDRHQAAAAARLPADAVAERCALFGELPAGRSRLLLTL